jgi:hypothetical protein
LFTILCHALRRRQPYYQQGQHDAA